MNQTGPVPTLRPCRRKPSDLPSCVRVLQSSVGREARARGGRNQHKTRRKSRAGRRRRLAQTFRRRNVEEWTVTSIAEQVEYSNGRNVKPSWKGPPTFTNSVHVEQWSQNGRHAMQTASTCRSRPTLGNSHAPRCTYRGQKTHIRFFFSDVEKRI